MIFFLINTPNDMKINAYKELSWNLKQNAFNPLLSNEIPNVFQNKSSKKLCAKN